MGHVEKNDQQFALSCIAIRPFSVAPAPLLLYDLLTVLGSCEKP